MIRVLFVCHGNICRSTMGQFLFRHLAEESGYRVLSSGEPGCAGLDAEEYMDIYVDSAATSREEIGNPVDRRTVAKLKEHGITCGTHYARQITKKDYEIFDLIILMDQENLWGIRRIIPEDPEHKIHLMLEYAEGTQYQNRDGSPRDVADPWYTGDFEETYQDLFAGCKGLISTL